MPLVLTDTPLVESLFPNAPLVESAVRGGRHRDRRGDLVVRYGCTQDLAHTPGSRQAVEPPPDDSKAAPNPLLDICLIESFDTTKPPSMGGENQNKSIS
jgi:hypothetical protein